MTRRPAAASFLFWWCTVLLHFYAAISILQIRSHSFQLGGRRSSPAFLCTKGLKKHCNHDVASSSSAIFATTTATEQRSGSSIVNQQQRQRRHDIFKNTNVISKLFPVPHQNTWRKFVSPHRDIEGNRENDIKKNTSLLSSFWDQILSSKGAEPHGSHHQLVNDVTVQFDDPLVGATELVRQCQLFPSEQITDSINDDNCKLSSDHPQQQLLRPPEDEMIEQEIIQHLANVLSYYQSIATHDNNEDGNSKKCQARIVSSIGEKGIKCPRWHADHVPVRLVMALRGAGCEYIPHELEVGRRNRGSSSSSSSSTSSRLVDRHALNNIDEDDTRIANDIIVPPNEAIEEAIIHAREGDAVLLMGRAWEEKVDITFLEDGDFTESSLSNNVVLAAVHRSPTLAPGQERILLTVDLVQS